MGLGLSFLIGCQQPEAIDSIDSKIDALISEMTFSEKVGQMNQVNGRTTDEDFFERIRKGEVGSILNIEQPELINKIQKISIEESRLGIPLLIARDVIHGYRTIFPIPLGQAASFNPELVKAGSRVAAIEATEDGIRWTFAPMMDVSRDPRWGRMAESFGEDVYLTSLMSVAMIEGFQGEDLTQPNAMAACAKHFIGYGAAEGGRDYNSTYIPPRQMRNVYFPPFKASVAAGCASIMTSFNDNDGIPASGNKELLTDILRDEWGFDGVVVSDWASVSEMVKHGFSADNKEAAKQAVNAGLDMEMVSETYVKHLEALVEEGKVSIGTIDNAVRNILRMKFRLGLFDNPYIAVDQPSLAYSEQHLHMAQKAAEESLVLLKNANQLLPLSKDIRSIAIIGPMADAPHDQMGTWVFDGEKQHTITPLMSIQEEYGDKMRVIYEPGLKFSRDKDQSGFSRAVAAAQKAEVVVFFAGEESILSGEAHSLADISLQGAQTELLKALKQTGKPVVTVIMAGRPLTIEQEVELSDAMIYAWHPGTMGGPAIANVLFGEVTPSGKLPVTFPKMVGQIPIYYNHNRTGRPARGNEVLLDNIPLEARQSSLGNSSYYLDAGFGPLFPFGFGLSYTEFSYSDLSLDYSELSKTDTLKLSFDLSNVGDYTGVEVVQVYINQKSASINRPVKELKSFKRVELAPGDARRVHIEVPVSELAFWGIENKWSVEAGHFNLMVGTSSVSGLQGEFVIQ